jgi:uncharacterized protein YlxP (DUF503 family)
MVIGLLQVEVHYPEAQSLKEKRFVLHSLLDRLRRQFNVSAAEVEQRDLWQKSVLGVVHVNTDRSHADSTLSKVVEFLESEPRIQVTGIQTEFL